MSAKREENRQQKGRKIDHKKDKERDCKPKTKGRKGRKETKKTKGTKGTPKRNQKREKKTSQPDQSDQEIGKMERKRLFNGNTLKLWLCV